MTDHDLINLGIQMRTDVPHIDPEVAWVGLAEDQANANGRDKGVTKLRFDDSCGVNSGCHGHGRGHGKILGDGMVGTNAVGMIGELAHGRCTDVPLSQKQIRNKNCL